MISQDNKTAIGYTLTKANYEYGHLVTVHSDTMNRDFPALVFTPENYKKNKENYPVVYLLHGHTTSPISEESLRMMYNPETEVKELANEYDVIIVAPLSGPSGWLDSPIKENHLFSSFVGIELTKYMDDNFRTIKSREGRILAGFSMGGYGAVSNLCRFPDTFSVALSRAGALNRAYAVEDLYWDEVDGEELLGNYWENREYYHKNSCNNLINHVRHRDDIAFVIEVGMDDFLYKTNRSFKDRLNELNIPHIYAEYPGGHQWGAEPLRSLLSHLQYFRKTIKYEE